MFKRQTTGAVVCSACGQLVGVNDDRCYHCGRRNPGLWGYAPALRRLGHDLGFVPFVTGACVVLYGLTLAASVMLGEGLQLNGFGFLGPGPVTSQIFGASGAYPVVGRGRWWTVLSASWLHGGLLHLFFNMYWIRYLAPGVGELYGPGRMVVIYTVAGVTGFAMTSLAGAYLPALPLLRGASVTLGASASIFGLLGALVYYGRRTGSSVVHGQAVQLAVIMAVFGLIMPGVDNFAHGGGFLGGFLMARWLDPLTPERVNHLLVAVICLAVSLLSVVVSVLYSLALLV